MYIYPAERQLSSLVIEEKKSRKRRGDLKRETSQVVAPFYVVPEFLVAPAGAPSPLTKARGYDDRGLHHFLSPFSLSLSFFQIYLFQIKNKK